MNEKAIYEYKRFGYGVTVFENRIEWSTGISGWGTIPHTNIKFIPKTKLTRVIPIKNISEVEPSMLNYVTLTLNSGKKVKLYPKPKEIEQFVSIISNLLVS